MKSNFLAKTATLLSLALMLLGNAVGHAAGTPKYIFYFIGDGMGMTPSLAAANYNRYVLGNTDLIPMMSLPVAGQVITWSANSPVTDSAAAGTALACGVKANNGMLGMSADTVAVRSVASLLKDQGYAVGLVTNVAPDDATPGAFYAHVPHRSMRPEIDRQYAAGNVDFLAGSALNGLRDKNGETDVMQRVNEAGIKVITGSEELAAAKLGKGRVLLVEKDPMELGEIGYVINGREDMLTLPVMTQACIDHLSGISPDKFFMMVEGGIIDHALHANDAGAAIADIFNFNEAIKLAMQFMAAHPDETLIVVTADHDTGGLALGNSAQGYVTYLDKFQSQKMSKNILSRACKDMLKSEQPATWEQMETLLKDNFGFWDTVKLSDKQTEYLRNMFKSVYETKDATDQQTMYGNFNSFAEAVFNILSSNAGIGWTTVHHTGTFVPVYAGGVGADNFGKVLDNTQIPKLILQIAGVN